MRPGVRVVARSGGMLTDAGGAEHGPYDLVVAADGARSALRYAVAGRRREREYRWGALWTILPDPDGSCSGVLDQVFDGTGRLLGLLPTGVPPHLGTRTVSLFWSVRCDRQAAVRAAGLDGAEGRDARAGAARRTVLAGLDSFDALVPAVYRDARLRQWHADGLAVVGDAGHAMSPQLGQGANLALMDAAALADALAREGTLAAALAAYSRARRLNLRYYTLASWALNAVFQHYGAAMAWPRDHLMGPRGARAAAAAADARDADREAARLACALSVRSGTGCPSYLIARAARARPRRAPGPLRRTRRPRAARRARSRPSRRRQAV